MTAPLPAPDPATAALCAARRAVEDADAVAEVVGWARGVLGTLGIALSDAERTADPVALQNVLSDVATAAGNVSRELCRALGWETS
ncbi:hypothetical protein [Corynebacterium glyciniphilum]|uniref:hypothetical protein n=1 Tax=Corynebacterium glyciniphilum TaxID=1404244 RepID=UPI003FCF83AF